MPDPTKQTLSATQTPALFGASPYLTRWMLLRHFIHGDPIDSPEHNRMDWGKRMQPLLLAQAAEDLHVEVHPNAGDTYVRRGLLGCTRDADIYCPDRGHGVLETKVVFDYAVWMRDWNGGKAPPKHVEIQTQQQMMVGDGDGGETYTWGVIGVWVCGEMKYFERKPLDELWHAINDEALKFFDDVRLRREGEPFGEAVEHPLLNRVFIPTVGSVVDLTEHPKAAEFASKAQLLNYHREQRAAHDKSEKALKALFKATLGNAEEAVLLHGIKVRQKQINKVAYSVKASSYSQLDVDIPESPSAAPPVSNILAGG